MHRIFTALVSLLPVMAAAESSHRAGHGSVTLSYQYISSDGFEGTQGELGIGQLDTHAINVDIDYHLTDRLTLVLGLPYIWERYRGEFPHDPLLLDPPRPEVRNVDTGSWNSDFQDVHFGARYLVRDGPLSVEPFLLFGIPSNSYEFFGHAAIGRNRDQAEIGSSFVFVPPISDAYYRFDLSYVFVEQTRGVSVNHWNLVAEAGYFFAPGLTGRIFVNYRDGDGIDFPDDFPPPPRTDEFWFQHDRLVRHNFTNVGAGLDWRMDENYRLSFAMLTMARAEQIHKVEYALTVGLTRSF